MKVNKFYLQGQYNYDIDWDKLESNMLKHLSMRRIGSTKSSHKKQLQKLLRKKFPNVQIKLEKTLDDARVAIISNAQAVEDKVNIQSYCDGFHAAVEYLFTEINDILL